MGSKIKNSELKLNPSLTCITCLQQCINESELKNIFSNDVVDGIGIVHFPNLLADCCNITVKKSDGLPEKICTGCKQQMKNFYAFKQMCNRSFSLLKSIYLEQKEIDPESDSDVKILSDDEDYGDEDDDDFGIKLDQPDYCFECKICDEIFNSDAELRNHVEAEHPEENPMNYVSIVSDEDCDEVQEEDTHIEDDFDLDGDTNPYQNNELLPIRRKRSRNKPYDIGPDNKKICHYCNRSFSKSSDIKRHIDTHFQVRYRCRVCPKMYTQLAPRNRHMKIYHPDEMAELLRNRENPFSQKDPKNPPITGDFVLKNSRQRNEELMAAGCSLPFSTLGLTNDSYEEDEYEGNPWGENLIKMLSQQQQQQHNK